MVEDFKCLGKTLTNQNPIQEQIKGRLKPGNAFYQSVQNFVFQFAIHKFKYSYIQNYNFAYYLYGCETWSLTMRVECRPRMFENRVLRRIFGPKKDGGTGEWRELQNEELNDVYFSPNITGMIKSKRMRCGGH